MRAVLVITDMDANERYAWADTEPILAEGEHASRYACLSDAIKDSMPWNDDDWSDGECLEYVMEVIKQLDGSD